MRAAGMGGRKRAAYHCDRVVWLPDFFVIFLQAHLDKCIIPWYTMFHVGVGYACL